MAMQGIVAAFTYTARKAKESIRKLVATAQQTNSKGLSNKLLKASAIVYN